MTDHPSKTSPEAGQAMNDRDSEVYKRLQQLQTHSRSNIAGLMAHRSTSTFTLHEEPIPAEANDRVLVVVYPQDPFVGEPEIRTMSAVDIQPNLVNSRVRVSDTRADLATPNRDGNYLYWPGDPRFDQVNTFYFVTFTLRMYERYARRALPWSFPSPRITIQPDDGLEANAYYAEQERSLVFQNFQINGSVASTAWSADIISHETAHAVLDGLRDLHNESFGLGPTAFHESFGDMTAILVALHDDSLIRRLLDWTKGNLRISNFVTEVAEHLADSAHDSQSALIRGQTIYLRNAINNFRNQPFDTLSYTPIDPEIELGRQGHNYSRLFTGAFYDILVGIYEFIQQDNTPPHIAIYSARNVVAFLLVAAVESGPVGEFDFSDMAKAFIAADQVLYDGRHETILTDVFDKRAILSKDDANQWVKLLKALPDIRLPKTINSALASALFLERDVLPKLNFETSGELMPMAAYRNAAGHAYLTYFTTQRIQLEGLQYQHMNGAGVDLFGGLTLMFDHENRLRSVFHRPITEEDIRQVRILTAELIGLGLITTSNTDAFSPRRGSPPEGILVPDTQFTQGAKETHQLIRFPMSIDSIPNKVSHFVEYLYKIKDKLHTGNGEA